MPWSTLRLKGGVNADLTPVQMQAAISSCNLIRFKDGMAQKLGGWSRFYPTAVRSTPRVLHAWEDLESVAHLAIAGDAILGVLTNGSLLDITPQTAVLNGVTFGSVLGSKEITCYMPGSNVGIGDTVQFNTPVSIGGLILNASYSVYEAQGPDQFVIVAGSNANTSGSAGSDAGSDSGGFNYALPLFSMQLGSTVVTTQFPNHGYSQGQTFAAIAPTPLAGNVIQGFYTVSQVIDANTFAFIASNPASATANAIMNGNQAQLVDYLAPYLNDVNTGYGINSYGAFGYGLGTMVPQHTAALISTSDWSVDNYGELLVACPKNGPVYLWGPTRGSLYAEAIAQAPSSCGGIFVAMPQQQIIAWGASVLGIRDPLLVRWCDIADYTDWNGTAVNQAGSFRLSKGSAIIGGMQASQQALLWTDLGLWSMQYIGGQLVYAFQEIASGCGLIAQHAAVEQGSVVFWMSQKSFYVLAGGNVQPVQSPVWDAIFQDIEPSQIGKIRAGANSQFNEVMWFYPSKGAAENDSYVKLNVLTGEWDYGLMARSAWIDQSVLGAPLGASPTGLLFQHETSPDADGGAMDSWFETGDFMIGESEDMVFIDQFYPDFRFGLFGQAQTATLAVTIKARYFPNSQQFAKGPYAVQQAVTMATQQINTRIRGRLISMRFESNDVGSFWRFGGCKFRYAPDGQN